MNDGLTAEKLAAMRESLRDHVTKMYAQFALLDRLISSRKLTKVRGGYRADPKTFERISLIVQGMTLPPDGKSVIVRLVKRSKKLDSLARQVGVKLPQ